MLSRVVAILLGGLLLASCTGAGANASTSPSTSPSAAPHFYRPIAADYTQQHLSPTLQRVVDGVVKKLPASEKAYVRWLPWYGRVIVFEIKPGQVRSDGRGYSPSPVINAHNLFVDPTNGNVFAGPPG